jgi:hypothetical protein
MTLVVGHADNEICFVVADTLLSHENFQLKDDTGPVNGEFHSLKVQILSGSLAVAFAGNFDEAYAAVRDLKKLLEMDSGVDPVEWLAARGLEESEFLVLLNSDRKQLFVVENGKAREAKNAYIGLQDDYKRFLELKQPYGGPSVRQSTVNGVNTSTAVTDGEKEFDVCSDAMVALSRDRVGQRKPAVGAISGCVIRVVDARISRELEYMQEVEASRFPWEPAGGYSVLAANTENRGVGIYFRAGGIGFLLPVCGEAPCVKSRAADLNAFIQDAKHKFGMSLEGGTWVN